MGIYDQNRKKKLQPHITHVTHIIVPKEVVEGPGESGTSELL